MKTKEKGDTTELHTTILKAVRVLFRRPFCQFAPTCFANEREDVYYFPEDMIRMAGNEKKSNGFSAEVWTSLFLKEPTVVDLVSTNIQVTIEQYLAGKQSSFGIIYSSALADKRNLLSIRDRVLAATEARPEQSGSSSTTRSWERWVDWSQSTGWYETTSTGSSTGESHWQQSRWHGWIDRDQ